MINERRLVDLFLKYVQIDSESRKEENFREVLEQDLRELGMEVTADEAGNLFSPWTGMRRQSLCCLLPIWIRWYRGKASVR